MSRNLVMSRAFVLMLLLATLLLPAPPALALNDLNGSVDPATIGHPTLEAIDTAWQNGEISEAEAILYRFYLVMKPQELPARFQGGPPLKCGTGFVLDAQQRLPLLSPDLYERIAPLLDRPVLPNSLETEHFMVHWDPAGVPNQAYVDTIAAACEQSWTTLHVGLSWDPPPSDGGSGGGSNKIDCYILDLGPGLLGVAIPETPVPGGSPYDYTGYFEIDDTIFNNCLLKDTVAHEYFHVVEFGYFAISSASWFMENCSMMAEEWVYDDCNDYMDYLAGFFNSVYKSIKTHNGIYEYGASVWPMFLEERFGAGTVRLVWDDLQWSGNIFTSLDNVLGIYGYNTDSAYVEFIRWCFYTRHRCHPIHFPEACQWPARLFPHRTHSVYPTGVQYPLASMRPEPWGTSVILFKPETGSTDNVIDVGFDGPDCTLAVQFFLKWAGTQEYFEYRLPLDASGNGTISLPAFDRTDSLFMFVSMSRSCNVAQDFAYWADTRFDATSAPDASSDPSSFAVGLPWPNPARDWVRMDYRLAYQQNVEVDILGPDGRLLRRLLDGSQGAGEHALNWDGRDDTGSSVGAGLYLARVRTADAEQSRKIILLK